MHAYMQARLCILATSKYTYVDVYTYDVTFIHPNMHTHIQIHTQMYMCTCIHMCTYVCTHIFQIYLWVYMYIYMYIYAYIYTHIYTHIPSLDERRGLAVRRLFHHVLVVRVQLHLYGRLHVNTHTRIITQTTHNTLTRGVNPIHMYIICSRTGQYTHAHTNTQTTQHRPAHQGG